MRFTRPAPDRLRHGFRPLAPAIAALLAAGAGCVLSQSGGDSPPADAGGDASTEADAGFTGADASDAADGDAASPGLDAGEADSPHLDDGGPLAVTCGSSTTSCAVQLSVVVDEAVNRDGHEAFCARTKAGTVVCWGNDAGGALGRGGNGTPSGNAAPVTGITTAIDLQRSCAVLADGTVQCWGTGPYLQEAGTSFPTPVQLPLAGVQAVQVLQSIGCARLSSGAVTCWGSSADGQLAYADGGSGPATVPLPSSPALIGFALGQQATFVIRSDGTALSWGAQQYLARVSSLSPDPYPTSVWLPSVSQIDGNGCAAAGGHLYCWGQATVQVGSIDIQFAPVMIPTGDAYPIVRVSTTWQPIPRRSPGQSNGPTRACVTTSAGDAYCMGNNDFGQIGDGTTTSSLTPVKVKHLPEPLVDVKVTPRTSCGLSVSGKVYCWGDGFFGQLGRGTPVPEAADPTPGVVVLP
jgi:alpha-tubulin suppressor-like RCC1 family protein